MFGASAPRPRRARARSKASIAASMIGSGMHGGDPAVNEMGIDAVQEQRLTERGVVLAVGTLRYQDFGGGTHALACRADDEVEDRTLSKGADVGPMRRGTAIDAVDEAPGGPVGRRLWRASATLSSVATAAAAEVAEALKVPVRGTAESMASSRIPAPKTRMMSARPATAAPGSPPAAIFASRVRSGTTPLSS